MGIPRGVCWICFGGHEETTGEDKAIDYVFGLLDIPWWYYAIAVLACVVAWRIWKRLSLGLLVGYAVLILAETVLIRKPFMGENLKLELLLSWKQWNVQRELILTNVVMFIPVGVLGGLSIVIEVLQLVSQRGMCENLTMFFTT